jgi:bifunctional DNase/RNase
LYLRTRRANATPSDLVPLAIAAIAPIALPEGDSK